MARGFTVNLYSKFTVIKLAKWTAYTLKIYLPYNSHNVMHRVSACAFTVKKQLIISPLTGDKLPIQT
jgi:hypothetical protein